MSDMDITNRALANAIRRIERLEGNEIYRKAWNKAARVLKEMMVEVNQSIIAKREEIGDV